MAKFCPECGKKVENGQKLCESCKAKKHSSAQSGAPWWILGAILPPVGLILYLVWNKDRKADAKSAGIGALVAAIIWLFFGLSFLIESNNKGTYGGNNTGENNVAKEVDVSKASKEVKEWYTAVTAEKNTAVTVIALSYCGYCKEYKPIITEIAKNEDLELYWFEIDTMSEEDGAILTGTYNLESYSGSSPYSFVTKDKKFLGDKVGYMANDATIQFLTGIGAI
jgi:thiol-disulfide isomerase/thioredoxin